MWGSLVFILDQINSIDLKHLDADHDSVDVEGAKRLFREHLKKLFLF